tara:strand:+ start:1735 stop:2451 length:717 start_codon:yes stop_codon:yes gene_type:complete
MLIDVVDTGLASDELMYKVVYLPYRFIRTDEQPTPDTPDVDMRHSYWTHQLYNFCPIENPTYFQAAGLEASNDPLYLDVLGYLEAKCPNLPPRAHMYACYINVLRFGNTPGIHVDAPHDVPSNKTVLIYLNTKWDPSWGGETIFYDHNLDAHRAVTPRPGRVVMFDGRIPHTGRPPTPRYALNRYIMTFKFMDPDVRQGLFTRHEVNNEPPIMDHGIAGFDPITVEKLYQDEHKRLQY